MKTNQEMTRPMGKFNVIQRTSDGYFNATHLLKQWNEAAKLSNSDGVKSDEAERRLDKFWDVTNLDKLMSEIAENELNFKSPNFGDLKNALSKACRGKKNGGTWMHPILFIKFAMYLSPRFEYHVLKFVSDEMIRYRNEAGDAYKEMSFQVQSISPAGVPFPDVIRGVSKAVNIVVYGKHERMIRNKVGEEGKVRELLELERDIAKMIKRKFIKNLVELRAFLLQEYRERHEPSLLIA